MIRSRRLATCASLFSSLAFAQMPGHPHVGSSNDAPSIAGLHDPVPDSSESDRSLPEGTLVVELLDGDEHPLPNKSFTLGIVRQSIAQGDKRERRELTTDAAGLMRLDGLATETAVAYRVSATSGPGSFGATPFRLPDGMGHRVRLHVVPVTTKVDDALIAMQTVALVDVKDDRILVQQALVAYNFGRNAWFADNVELALPQGATALTTQQSMSDRSLTLDGSTAKLRGTFPPGESTVEYQWQIPYGETALVDLTIGLPPHVAVARAMAIAGPGNTLVVDDFAKAEQGADGRGQRMLLTEKSFKRGEAPATSMTMRIGGLPTPGPVRWIASAVALVTTLGTALWALSRRRKAPVARDHAEIEALARSHARALAQARTAGEVGPATFEAEKRRLIDDLAKALSA